MSLHADDNEDEELSGGEDDEDFNKDMEEIRKACILTGTDPTDLKITSNASDGSSSDGESTGARAAGGAAPATDSDDDDLELVRDIQNRFSGAGISSDPVTNSDDDQEDHELLESIKNRFSITSDVPQILSLKPLCALPPAVSDEDEDDFETLRAIQKRFSAYDNAAEISKSIVEKSLKKPEVVNNSILCSEEETADRLIFNRTDAQDACTTTNLLSENVEMRHCGFLESNKSEACKSSKLTGRSSSFPVSAQLLIDAIKKNRSYQKFLRSKLIQIEAKIEENKKLKERVKILKDFQVSCRKRTGHALSLKKDPRVQLISAKRSYASNNSKVSAMYYGPEENTHVTNYRMVLERFPLSLDRRKWSKADKENLGKGIRQKFQEMVLQISIDRFSGSEGSDANDFDNIFASIKDLDITPEKIREFVPKVNWDQLASMYVIGHSGAECEARWLNYEDPLINQNPWTCEEDKTLLLIVEEKGIRNWFNISISMGTNRTPFQCLARYQRSLNPSILNREWTEEEDAKLRSAVEAFGESNWQSVASSLERRTGTQCSNRWKKSLHPERKGGFTPDEDKRLKVAVMLFGRKWNKIAQFVPGRTQAQCRDRYVNCLDPSLKWGGWSEEEDSTLKVAIAKHGYCWSKVAEDVPPRTDSQCRKRWMVLFPDQFSLLQAARKMQKAALISNFVDRESERPALRLNDFLPLPVICSAPEIETVYSSRKTRSNLPKKNRPKKCLKEAHMISDEVQDIVNCNEVETSGGYAIHEEQTTEPQPERNHLVEEVLDHSPLPSDLVLMTTNTKGKRLSKLTTRRKKFTESDQESQRCHLVPESPESGTTNDNCRKAISKNTSNKKSGARKQRIRRKVCTVEPREHYRSTESFDKSMFSGSNHNTGYQNDHLSIPDSTHSEEIDKHGWDDSTRKQAASKLHPKSKVHTVADSHSFSSPPESSELKISDAGVGSSLSGTTISKKKGVATNKQSRKVISAELSGNQQKKLKGSNPRGLPSSKQLCGRADGDDITLASFLWNKSKKRKLEATINDTDSCFPSSSKAGSESLSNLETLHVLQDRVPTNTLSPGYPQSDDLRNTASTASVTEPSGADLVKEKNVAPHGPERDAVYLNMVTGHEDGDITLASLLGNKSKKRFRGAKCSLYSCSSSGSKKQLELPSEEVRKHQDGNEMLHIMRSEESDTGCNDCTSREWSVSNLQSSYLKNTPIITTSENEPGRPELVKEQSNLHDAVREPMSSENDPGDVTLASFLLNKSKRKHEA